MLIEGQHLGDFEILEHLGQGGMGAVFKARQTALRRLVALKTLKPFVSDDPEFIARFRNEAVAAAALNHPNLVQVYAAGEAEGIHYFAMEYVAGESAQARIKRKGRLDPLEAIALVTHVTTALEHGWRKAGLIHRDIKPDNIFLSDEGEVKLGDLGLAKSAGQTQGLTMTGASMGTPHYISPEQAEGKKDIDLRTDIYSLGCTLYHLLVGKPPYAAASAMALMLKHVSAPVPDLRGVWPDCPPALAALVLKMMQKAPADRPQSHEEMIADLRHVYDLMSGTSVPEIVAGTQQPAARPKAVAPKAEPAKSKLPLYAGVAAVALAIVAAALIWAKPPKSGGTRSRASQTSVVADGRDQGRAGARPSEATKDAPFVNTLGMKFVPVPIVTGPTAGQRVLFGVWDVRVQDYAIYAAANPKADGAWKTQNKDGVAAGGELDHPVVGVSWDDAQAFCAWLTEKEQAEGKLPKGMKYRLPSDEEWSWAVGMPPELGTTPAEKQQKNSVDFPWGKDYPPTKKVGNYGDEAFHAKFPVKKNGKDNKMENDKWIEGYNDGYATTSPVGSFPANAYGLYDMGGNVWQWCEDWFDASHKDRVMRGASWTLFNSGPLLSSFRYHFPTTYRFYNYGFRCVVSVSGG